MCFAIKFFELYNDVATVTEILVLGTYKILAPRTKFWFSSVNSTLMFFI